MIKQTAGPVRQSGYAHVEGRGRSLRAQTAAEGKRVELSQLSFDPFLRCTHPAVRTLVREAVEAAERNRLWRARRRRMTDLEALYEQSLAIVSNAAYALATGLEPPTVGITVGRPSRKRIVRYEGPALGQIESALSAVSPRLITLTRSRRKGVASVLQPGDGLREHLGQLPDFGMRCFSQEGKEAIILRRVERSANTRKTRINLDYAETDETRRVRAEMERLNAALATADISLEGAAGEPGSRWLCRIFNSDEADATDSGDVGRADKPARLTLGGRLYRGWWIDWPSEGRGRIRIDGQPVVDLDYRNMHLRLAYIAKGIPPPPGDLYAGILATPEEDAACREGIKRFVNALLSRNSELKRKPQNSADLLPRGVSAAELREAVFRRHAPIADLFETGAGGRFQRTDSDIMVAILLRLLTDRGIIALPMHDGLMVRHDHAAAAKVVMEEVSKEALGYALEVK